MGGQVQWLFGVGTIAPECDSRCDNTPLPYAHMLYYDDLCTFPPAPPTCATLRVLGLNQRCLQHHGPVPRGTKGVSGTFGITEAIPYVWIKASIVHRQHLSSHFGIEREPVWLGSGLRSGACAIDVGAHLGLYTYHFSKCVGPTGHVVSLEPHPITAARLRRFVRCARLSNVQVVEAAATSTEATQRTTIGTLGVPLDAHHGEIRTECALKLAADESGEGRRYAGQHALTVPLVTLDQLDIPCVDALKLDVEGSEFEVLNGGLALIRRHRPHIVCELENRWLVRNGHDASDVFRLLCGEFKYSAHVLTASHAVARVSGLVEGHNNYLFLPDGETTRLGPGLPT